jgi:hypothetical protein
VPGRRREGLARRPRGRPAAGAVLSRRVHAAGAIADIACQNKAVLYDLLFKVSAETLLTIAADPKHLGGRIGITSVAIDVTRGSFVGRLAVGQLPGPARPNSHTSSAALKSP